MSRQTYLRSAVTTQTAKEQHSPSRRQRPRRARGLLAPAARIGGQRRYEAAAIERLIVIRFCQALGFSLAEVLQLLTPPSGAPQKERWRGLVDSKVEELDAVLRRIRTVQKILRASRDCDCVDLAACAAACSPSLPDGPA